MTGLYQAASQRRSLLEFPGASALAGLSGHFDGRRAVFQDDVGLSGSDIGAGTLIDTGLPFQQVIAGSEGELKFVSGFNGLPHAGINMTHPETANVNNDQPFISWTMTPGVGTDPDWMICFVYSVAASAMPQNHDFAQFECDNFRVLFRGYGNNVVAASGRYDLQDTSAVGAISGGVTTTGNFDDGGAYMVIASHSAADGFAWFGVNLQNMEFGVPTEGTGHRPIGITPAFAERVGEGVFTFGLPNNPYQPDSDADIVLCEVFYATQAVTLDSEALVLAQAMRRKWVQVL